MYLFKKGTSRKTSAKFCAFVASSIARFIVKSGIDLIACDGVAIRNPNRTHITLTDFKRN
jgi:hypothetical protein